jgi:glycerol-3-phosphate acyltransferase PlsY
VLWFVIVGVTHKASLASIVVVVAYPIAVALAGHPWGDVTVIAAVAVLVVARHAANLKRLFRGEELGIDPGAREDGEP